MEAVYEPSRQQKIKHVVTTTVVVILIVMSIAVFERYDSELPQLQNVRRASEANYLDTNGKTFPWQQLRLPRYITPMEYHIRIYPDFRAKTFNGSVTIQMLTEQQTKLITLHGKKMKITNVDVNIESKDGSIWRKGQVRAMYESQKLEMHILEMTEILLERTKVNVTLAFEGKLMKKLSGFYLSNYTKPEGEVKYLAATLFEPTSAREAFPCFDEPDMKAKFTISIARSKDQISLSNMPLLTSTTYNRDIILDTFQQTVKMSTYLVAFVVCDFQSVNRTTSQGTKVRVYAPPHQISQANFALDTAVKVLDFYNKLFGIKYPLPKQDLVALPDFAAGAMENWGLITFQLTAILLDPDVSSARDRQYVVIVIAHELAHQWFGNLVSLKWWNDVWLNEGFATFVEYLGANEIDPSFSKMDLFVQSEMINTMAIDCEGNSHPVTATVSDPSQINGLFDAISYGKGASLIRMLSNFMGEEKFWDGIKKYLNTYKFGNARTEDLWDILTEFTQTNVSSMMDTWTKQMGYPVITMKRKDEGVQVTQEHFLLGRQKAPLSPYNYKWNIPFRYAVAKTSGISDQLINIHMDSGTKFQADHDQVKWMKGNYGMYGYYRVNYEESNWRALIKQLTDNHTVFSSTDRAGLIDDVCFLARAHKVSQTMALNMTKYLRNEGDYLPWSVALDCLTFIGERLRNKAVYDKLQKYTVGLMHPIIAKLSWEDTGSLLDKFLRSLMIDKALEFGHQTTIKNGKTMFHSWMKDGKKLNVNLKGEIYRAGAQYGDISESNFIYKEYIKAPIPSEKHTLLVALCYTSHESILQRLLKETAKGDVIRHQDLRIIMAEISKNPKGQLLAWIFLKDNWNNILEWFSGSLFVLPDLIQSATSSFSSVKRLAEVKAFFNSVDASAGKRQVLTSLNQIQMNIDWLENNEDEVTSWFKDPGNILLDNS
ncbi:Endoplasmic reticulum aminopeptidase 2 [Mizuhopecten yessoensis]|uniref:Aminopeptidase n=1 Tax=Mizuhopecten yessoensis TaxID=6573 RepID=A0A210Q850_MIZYE|nr:Endoplasmic reticulum aminopeptidase 2 [Mizuhopecten yessoensis]